MNGGDAEPTTKQNFRFDLALRAIMWMDAFLSVALVVWCVIASPIVATFGVPLGIRLAVGIAVIVCAALLAAFGAVTAALIMLRMRAGHYFLPIGLRLPLPAPMRPTMPSEISEASIAGEEPTVTRPANRSGVETWAGDRSRRVRGTRVSARRTSG